MRYKYSVCKTLYSPKIFSFYTQRSFFKFILIFRYFFNQFWIEKNIHNERYKNICPPIYKDSKWEIRKYKDKYGSYGKHDNKLYKMFCIILYIIFPSSCCMEKHVYKKKECKPNEIPEGIVGTHYIHSNKLII